MLDSAKNCLSCHRVARNVASAIGLCPECCRISSDLARLRAATVHEDSRAPFALPPAPPRVAGGVPCTLCGNECIIGEGGRGYCGLRTVRQGRLIHLAGTPRRGLLQWYRDPLPTNCVADWVCEGSRQSGCHNLAVFYASCTADCLYCQNWHFRDLDLYVPRLNFVFGLADQAGRRAIIALPRLRQSYYRLPDDKALFQQRVLKEAVHELGHVFNIGHCEDRRCVMTFSNSLADTDFKSHDFCSTCRRQLRR